jgi:hypothetical protein
MVRIGAEKSCFFVQSAKREPHKRRRSRIMLSYSRRSLFTLQNACSRSKRSLPRDSRCSTSDTDELVIALGNSYKFPDCKLQLEVGPQRINSLRFIDITSLSIKLGPVLCRALPGFHAFTGSDYTQVFYYKGKISPLKILEKRMDTCWGQMKPSPLKLCPIHSYLKCTETNGFYR